MSDRIKGFVVALEDDYKEEDIEFIEKAIKMIKGVDSVDYVKVDHSDYINRLKIHSEYREKFLKFLHKELSYFK